VTGTSPVTEFPIYRARIEPDWIDYNGHLRDAYYGLVASYAVNDGAARLAVLDVARVRASLRADFVV